MLNAVLMALVALMPVAIVTGPDFPSTIFYLTLASALAVLVQHRFAGVKQIQRQYHLLIVCIAAPLAVVLFAALWHGHMASSNLETSLRLLLGTWVLVLALSYSRTALLWQATWGLVAAAVAATIFIGYLSWPSFERPETDAVYNAVGYGNHTIMLAVLVLFSMRWTVTPWPRLERILKLVVATVALTAFVLTQTRSGLVAVPAFAVIAALLFSSNKHPMRIAVATVAVLAVMTTVFLSSDTLRSRAVLGYKEAVSCTDDRATTNNSICIRLQLWRASLDMLAENPVAGIGDKRSFGDQLQDDSLPKGIVSPAVAEGWGEPHNDILLALATFGVPGGIALLLVYLAPAWVFARRMAFRHPAAVRTAAAMGLAFCLGFLIFGLAETMLRGMRTASYYAMVVALLLALSDPGRYEVEGSERMTKNSR